ncbi:hypothetical protein MNBD_GAMMA17-1742 [hydrothermal vent metagenome]|uniref:Uncharacterized protein n=1 Tax=hydrothermal vent metagenome TaxID=652676 RepID=A0A3B0Z3L2_9ZZZZ
MSIQQKPNVGSWYINLTGQLLKVWAVSYSGSTLSKVVIEYLSGSRVVIDIDQWDLLDLEVNFEKIARRRKVEESQR